MPFPKLLVCPSFHPGGLASTPMDGYCNIDEGVAFVLHNLDADRVYEVGTQRLLGFCICFQNDSAFGICYKFYPYLDNLLTKSTYLHISNSCLLVLFLLSSVAANFATAAVNTATVVSSFDGIFVTSIV